MDINNIEQLRLIEDEYLNEIEKMLDAQSFDFEQQVYNAIQNGYCNMSLHLIRCYRICKNAVQQKKSLDYYINQLNSRSIQLIQMLTDIKNKTTTQKFVDIIEQNHIQELVIRSDNGELSGENNKAQKQSGDILSSGNKLQQIFPSLDIVNTLLICQILRELSDKVIETVMRCINNIDFEYKEQIIDKIRSNVFACLRNKDEQYKFNQSNAMFQSSCKTYSKNEIPIAEYKKIIISQTHKDKEIITQMNYILQFLTLAQSLVGSSPIANIWIKPLINTNEFERHYTDFNQYGYAINVTDIFNLNALIQTNNIFDQLLQQQDTIQINGVILNEQQTLALTSGLIASKNIEYSNLYKDHIIYSNTKKQILSIGDIMNSKYKLLYNSTQLGNVYNNYNDYLEEYIIENIDKKQNLHQFMNEGVLHIFELDEPYQQLSKLQDDPISESRTQQMIDIFINKQFKTLQTPCIQFQANRQLLSVNDIIQEIVNEIQEETKEQIIVSIDNKQKCGHGRLICANCNICEVQDNYGLYVGWIKCKHDKKTRDCTKCNKEHKCKHKQIPSDCNDCKYPCKCTDKIFWKNCKICKDYIYQNCCLSVYGDQYHIQNKQNEWKNGKCSICICKCEDKNINELKKLNECVDCIQKFCKKCMYMYLKESKDYKILGAGQLQQNCITKHKINDPIQFEKIFALDKPMIPAKQDKVIIQQTPQLKPVTRKQKA